MPEVATRGQGRLVSDIRTLPFTLLCETVSLPAAHFERGACVLEEDRMAIFTHVTVGTNDLAKSRSFYDRVLGTLGYKRLNDLGDNGSIWGESAPEFFLLKPPNRQPASFDNGGTSSVVAPSCAQV